MNLIKNQQKGRTQKMSKKIKMRWKRKENIFYNDWEGTVHTNCLIDDQEVWTLHMFIKNWI